MKTTKLVSFAVAGLVLAGMGGQVAHADEVVVNSDGTDEAIAKVGVNNTTTTVEIIDSPDGTDPIDPTDPNQKMLTLEKVPALYSFESKLMNGAYEITTGKVEGDPITVFNDRIDRGWSVKAMVKDDQLAKTATGDTFAVTSFSLNGKDIVTGTDSIVAEAVDAGQRTGENNTGTLETAVTSIGIGFKDVNGVLKVGDTIEGLIQYTLYNTTAAE